MKNIIFYIFYLVIFIVTFIISINKKYPLLEALIVHKISNKMNKK